MGARYLMDSNVVIDFLSGRFSPISHQFIAQIVDEEPTISLITKIEILGFNAPQQDAILLDEFIKISQIVPLSDAIATETIRLRKLYKIKLPDAIIAATAMVEGSVLLTRNLKDFNTISDLKVQNPHELA